MTATKKCSKCQRELPIKEFYSSSTSSDGLYYYCKQCARDDQRCRRKARQAQGTLELPEQKQCCACGELKSSANFWRDLGAPDGLQAYCKQCSGALRKRWRDTNLEQARELEHQAYLRNQEARQAAARRYYAQNPTVAKAAARRYRALKAQARGSFTQAEFRELCTTTGCRCLACGGGEHEVGTLTADHIVPLSEGGANDISKHTAIV